MRKMGDIININNSEVEITELNTEIQTMTDAMLLEARSTDVPVEKSISVPIAQLSTLGAGVSSLIPAFNTVTQTITMNTQGLYQLANASVGDTLKVAKNGNFWGAFKTAEGGSKFAQLKAADPITATNEMVINANPATMMMAVALFSIEKELGDIKKMQKQILSFLQIEKEAEIEADVITLGDIVSKYKHNWDNERFVASNHKMVCDIQRTARKNMIAFQKQVEESLKSKQLIVLGSKVNSTLTDMQKKFQYYRLALYTFSLSSLAEIMLSGNFKDENINAAIDEIHKNSDEYRSLFGKCSVYLEKLSKGSVETSIRKGVGAASNAVGKFIGIIPKVKDGQVDEFLIEKGEKIRDGAQGISREVIESFAEVSNPNTGGFISKLEDMDKIYNQTKEICFDKDNLYLIAG